MVRRICWYNFKILDRPLISKSNSHVLAGGRDEPLGISEGKKNGILKKLVPLMPGNKRKFWEDVVARNGVADLVSDIG